MRIGAALVVLLALAGYLAVQYSSGSRSAPRCVVTSGVQDGETYEFSARQAVNAATISAVGTSRGMPERAVTIALATALQESALRNIEHGDRDSLGLFQQRPSQGWGTAKQIMDPVYSAEKFYEHLDEVPGYSRLPLTVAAQRVQRSGFPQAYAKHEPDAALLAAALTGRAPGTLTCDAGDSTGAGGGTEVSEALVRDFGKDVLPSTAAAGSDAAGSGPDSGKNGSGSGTDSSAGGGSSREDTDSDEAQILRIPVPAAAAADDDGASRRGWELAHWAVAHASDLRIEQVSYAGREWSADDADDGWSGEEPAAKSPQDGARDEAGGEVRIVTAR